MKTKAKKKNKIIKYDIGGDIISGATGFLGGVAGDIPFVGGIAQKGIDAAGNAIIGGHLNNEEKSIEGYGQAAGGITGDILSGGATTGNSIGNIASGVGQGVSAGSPNSGFAKGVGTGLNMGGQAYSMYNSLNPAQTGQTGQTINKMFNKGGAIKGIEPGFKGMNNNSSNVQFEDGGSVSNLGNIGVSSDRNQFGIVRRSLGNIYKFGGMIPKYDDGGGVDMNDGEDVDDDDDTTINAEGSNGNKGGELIVNPKTGFIKRDLKSLPPHPANGEQNPDGDVKAQEGDFVIPKDMREDYLKGDKLTRASIINNIRREQIQREGADNKAGEAFEKGGAYIKQTYGEGGRINSEVHIKPSYKPIFNKGAKVNKMSVKDYSQKILTNKIKQPHPNSPVNNMGRKMYATGGGVDDGTNPNSYYPSLDNIGLSNPIPSFITPVQSVNTDTNTTGNIYDELASSSNQNIPNNNPSGVGGDSIYDSPISGSPKDPKSFDYAGVGKDLLKYSPSIYNLGKGIFDTTATINPNDYKTTNQMKYRPVNMQAVQNRITGEGRVALNNIKNASGGNSGSYLSGATQTGANQMSTKADAELKAQEVNINQADRVDEAGNRIGEYNTSNALRIKELNDKAAARRSAYISEGLTGASEIVQQKDKTTQELNALKTGHTWTDKYGNIHAKGYDENDKPITTQKNGGNVYKRGGLVKKNKLIRK